MWFQANWHCKLQQSQCFFISYANWKNNISKLLQNIIKIWSNLGNVQDANFEVQSMKQIAIWDGGNIIWFFLVTKEIGIMYLANKTIDFQDLLEVLDL
jgi:hypothetical protein